MGNNSPADNRDDRPFCNVIIESPFPLTSSTKDQIAKTPAPMPPKTRQKRVGTQLRETNLLRRKHSREECEFRVNVAGKLRRYLAETLDKLADLWVVLRHLFEVGDWEDNVPK
jgi:hypothetical protein